MITKEQRESDFRLQLQHLLDTHGAGMYITDDGKPYGLQRGVCRITMQSVYANGEPVMEYCEFEVLTSAQKGV